MESGVEKNMENITKLMSTIINEKRVEVFKSSKFMHELFSEILKTEKIEKILEA
jgi:hypothetical protein